MKWEVLPAAAGTEVQGLPEEQVLPEERAAESADTEAETELSLIHI